MEVEVERENRSVVATLCTKQNVFNAILFLITLTACGVAYHATQSVSTSLERCEARQNVFTHMRWKCPEAPNSPLRHLRHPRNVTSASSTTPANRRLLAKEKFERTK